MTDEQFEKATDIKSDLELLRNLLKTSNANHWIGFVREEEPRITKSFNTSYMQDRFERFILEEINNLKKQFEEL